MNRTLIPLVIALSTMSAAHAKYSAGIAAYSTTGSLTVNDEVTATLTVN